MYILGGMVFLFLLIYFIFYLPIKPTSRCKDKSLLRENAKPIDMKRESRGDSSHCQWITTIIFDDGFEYVSKLQDRERVSSRTTRVFISPETHQKIIANAVEAHKNYVRKHKK